MNLAHLHLLLNHFPIIGTVIGLGVFIASFIAKSDDLKSAGLTVFAGVALLSLPAFFSGVGAQAALRRNPAVSAALIERHEGSAILALFFVEITGALACWALIERPYSRRPQTVGAVYDRPAFSIAILLFSIVTAGLMARVGTTGG